MAMAQATSSSVDSYVIPNFWDPVHRDEKPDLSNRPTIRFLVEAQNPPFSFIGADGLPTGFHVDLARAICLELELACTVQTLRWDLLVDGLDEDRGDAIIASLVIDEQSRTRYAFSQSFLTRPARFVTRRDAPASAMLPDDLAGRTIAVIGGTAHEAFLRDLFPRSEVTPFPGQNEARAALMAGEVDALFGDGLSLSLWLNGAASRNCCAFRGGPYLESRYFGEGFAVAVPPEDRLLQRAMNYALNRLHADGTYGEIYQRYFPVSFY